ncbi:MAG: DUF3667 domain-containing protein, partial [Flavobacteriales bacterium]|nr:DUF3667 domain-containing protein [Flavobacteriales bacterium]
MVKRHGRFTRHYVDGQRSRYYKPVPFFLVFITINLVASNLLDVDQLFTDSSLDQFQLSESQRNIFSKFREVNNDWGKYLVFFNVV